VLAPISGAIAYFLLGINRIQRSANALERPGVRGADGAVASALPAAVDPALRHSPGWRASAPP